MDFKDRVLELAAKIPQQLEHISTEEATKNALVMPFINALGQGFCKVEEKVARGRQPD